MKQLDDDIVSLGSDSYASEEIEADLIAVEDENFVVVKSLYVASFKFVQLFALLLVQNRLT